MRRLQSFKRDVSPVRVDRSDLDEDGELLEGGHSLLNPDNVSVEDAFDRFRYDGRLLSDDALRGSRNPMSIFLRRFARRENRRQRSR